MIITGRPSGLTPWRIVLTQSLGVYRATTPAGAGVMSGERMSMPLPSSTTTLPAPSAPWQPPQPRERNR
jgi:hypothetical protein